MSARVHVRILGCLSIALVAMATPRAAWSQGCVRPVGVGPGIGGQGSGPVVGSQGSAYLLEGRWQASLGYRWLRSHRHFVGTTEQYRRRALQNEVVNNTKLFDVATTYAFTDQFNLTLDVPVVFNRRSSGSQITGARTEVESEGIGDLTLVGRWWLQDVKDAHDGNISLGLGFKLPTGDEGATDTLPNRTPAARPVDQSIQPGDGGFGILLDFSMFKSLDDASSPATVACSHGADGSLAKLCPNPGCAPGSSRPEHVAKTFYASGTYLINPRNTNGVQTFRGFNAAGVRTSTPGAASFYEQVMSVADSYVARAGFTFTNVTRHPKLTLGIGLRLEGVPVEDLIGDSDGFRRPGHTTSLEPSLIYSLGPDETFSLAVPVAMQRNRAQSLADQRASEVAGVRRHGDAAFADFYVLAGYTRRF